MAAADLLDVLSVRLLNRWEKFGSVGDMKLYKLMERWGGVVSTPFKPRVPAAPEEDLEEALAEAKYPGYYPWEDIPWDLDPALAWELGKALTLYGFRVLGLRGRELFLFIKAVMTNYQAAYLTWAPVAKVVGLVIPYLVLLGILYIVNPEERKFEAREEIPFPYIMRYQEQLWWADLVRITPEGTGWYWRCAPLRVGVWFEVWNVPYKGGFADRWEFGKTWVEYFPKTLDHKTWAWSTAWVEYVGLMSSGPPGYYRLRPGREDPDVREAEWPWIKPEAEFCDFRRGFEF